MNTIFISHCERDAVIAKIVSDNLTGIGLKPYLAENNPRPGALLSEKVRAGMLASRMVIVLVSASSKCSEYVQQEIGMAHQMGRPIVPISIDGTKPGGLLAGLEYFDLQKDDLDRSMARFQNIMKAHKSDMDNNDLLGSAIIVGGLLTVLLLALASKKEEKKEQME